mgnify:FL=1
MQTKAIIKAAINVKKNHPDWTVKPEIMIPLVGDVKELKFVKKVVVETADAEIAAAGSDLTYEVGTMIEIPRAALTADEIAKEADFFCFGTNDLTQMTYGFSRDDAGKFLGAYYDAKIFESDPFAKLDQTGVGKLMKMAIELGKPVNDKLHCVSAVSTAVTRHLLSSATKSVWTMFPARRSVCRSQDWLLHRLQSRTSNPILSESFFSAAGC